MTDDHGRAPAQLGVGGEAKPRIPIDVSTTGSLSQIFDEVTVFHTVVSAQEFGERGRSSCLLLESLQQTGPKLGRLATVIRERLAAIHGAVFEQDLGQASTETNIALGDGSGAEWGHRAPRQQ